MKISATGAQFDCIKGSIVTLTLFLAYIAVPLVGMIPGLFAPLPVMYYSVKSGKGTGYLIIAISTVVLSLLTDVATTVLFLMQCGVMAIAIPHFLINGKPPLRGVTYAVAINFGLVLLLAVGYAITQGVDLHGQILKGIAASINQTAQLYQKSGISGEDLKNLQEGLRQAGVLIGKIYPALLLLSLATIAIMNLAALARISARLPNPVLLGDFRKFRNPDQLVWLFIAAGFGLLASNPEIKGAAWNLMIVTLFLYFMQGLAVIEHLFARYNIKGFMRWFFYILIFLQPYLTIAVALLGVFDLWGDFRTPKQQENL
jgi:uncharacterized protein YybS (DUF2232 family)